MDEFDRGIDVAEVAAPQKREAWKRPEYCRLDAREAESGSNSGSDFGLS